MRRPSTLFLTATAALAAGCGSTVAGVNDTVGVPNQNGMVAPSGTVPSAGASGLTAPAGTTANGSGSTATLSGAGTSGSTTTGTTPTGTSGAYAPTTGGGSTGATRATAPGITATKIYAGFEYSSDAAAGNRAIGAAGAAASYDARDVYKAVIDYANKHGGFGGRQLEPYFHDISVADDRSVSDQAACDDFTNDHKIFAMEGSTEVLRTCAEKAGAISIGGGNTVSSTYEKYPHFVEPYFIRLDRLGPVTVNGLYKNHYFSGKLGLITWDDPNYRYGMQHGYLPALHSHSITETQVAYVSVPQQIGAVADMSAAMSSIVNKFRALGIDHVIIQDGPAGVWAGGGLTLEFMNQAKSQRYYPRYGQNALNLPGSTILPSDQQDKALAIMDSDYAPKFDDGIRPNPSRQKCFKIQEDAGLPVHESNENDEVTAAQVCDFIFFLQLVVNRLPVITADSFVQAVAGLGTRFGSAFTYGTRFFKGRRDGADLVRTAEYFDSCKCLKYRGGPYRPD